MSDSKICPNCQQLNKPEAINCKECKSPLPDLSVAAPQVSSIQNIGTVQSGANVVGNIVAHPGSKVTIGGGSVVLAYVHPPLPPSYALPDPGDLPPGSRLPFSRNAKFTGRANNLLDTARALLFEHTGPLAVTQAIAGLGGIGKTQFAVELCYRYGRYTHGVHWINAAGTLEQNNLEAEISACGLAMNISGWPELLPEQVAATLYAWKSQPDRLVVLDSLEDPALLSTVLPRLGGVHLLVTTRRHAWPTHLGVNNHPLDTLPRMESLTLLRKLARRLEKIPDIELDPLAARLCDLPLALHLAGSYLSRVASVTPADYLNGLEKAGGALKFQPLPDSMKDSPTQHELSLYLTFLLSWQRLKEDDATDIQARFLFRACGYCAPNVDIPLEILPYPREGRVEVELAFSRLYELGLAEVGEAGVRLHPLLAEFARVQDLAETKSALPNLVIALVRASSDANGSGLPARFSALRPHMRPVAMAAEEAKLERAGTLWNNWGFYLQNVADFNSAKAAYERALRIDKETFGPQHPRVALDLSNLGTVLQDMDKLEEAQAACEEAVHINEKVYGSDDVRVARAIINLGSVFREQGKFLDARKAFERALLISEEKLGLDDPQVASIVNHLGLIMSAQSNLKGARKAHERALKIIESVYGMNHPSAARYSNNLGWVLWRLDDLVGAQTYFERALDVARITLGNNHPTVADYECDLAGLNQVMNNWDEAGKILERALYIYQISLGPTHTKVARCIRRLGTVQYCLGKYHEASDLYKQAMNINEAIHGGDHWQIATDLLNLGCALREIGELNLAKNAFLRALEIHEKEFGLIDLRVARDVQYLGGVFELSGELDLAKDAYERALNVYGDLLDTNHSVISSCATDMVRILKMLNDEDKAMVLIEKYNLSVNCEYR